MDNAQRLQYLDAMGIDVWVPRHQAPDRIVGSDDIDLQSEQDCQQCQLYQTGQRIHLGADNFNTDWLIIHDEHTLSSEAELLLTEMFKAIGLDREAFYVTSIVKCMPEQNQPVKMAELFACQNYLRHQIQLIQPKIIIVMGKTVAEILLAIDAPLSELRGVVHQLNQTPLVVLHHPAYLLQYLDKKSEAWQDLQLAIQQMRT